MCCAQSVFLCRPGTLGVQPSNDLRTTLGVRDTAVTLASGGSLTRTKPDPCKLLHKEKNRIARFRGPSGDEKHSQIKQAMQVLESPSRGESVNCCPTNFRYKPEPIGFLKLRPIKSGLQENCKAMDYERVTTWLLNGLSIFLTYNSRILQHSCYKDNKRLYSVGNT